MDFVIATTFDAPYVTHDAGALAGAVVLRPATAVDRLAPLPGEPSPIADRALEQHAIFVGTLRDVGVAVTAGEPSAGSPAESLVGDVAVVLPQGAILVRPANVERRAETVRVEALLGELGIPIAGRLEAPGLLDGGDVALGEGTVYLGVRPDGPGFRPRSNELGRAQFAALAASQGLRVVEVALAPGVLRLRNVFNFVARDTVVVARERVDVDALASLRTIELPRGEEYAAGILALGERRVLANVRYRESTALLRKAKIAVESIDLWEFGKAGAGPFSLAIAAKRG